MLQRHAFFPPDRALWQTSKMLPKTPIRTDAYIECACGGTMGITQVMPVQNDPSKMRHYYECVDCGKSSMFEVDKAPGWDKPKPKPEETPDEGKAQT